MVRVDLVAVKTTERLADSNMFQQQNQGSNEEVGRDGGDQVFIDMGLADVLESTRNGLEDADDIVALLIGFVMANQKPRGERQKDDDKAIAHHREIEEEAGTVWITPAQPLE